MRRRLESNIEESGQNSTTTFDESQAVHQTKGLRVLVAYASKAGSTKGIAEFVGEKLRKNGTQVDVSDVGAVSVIGSFDAFVKGSALN